MMVNTLTFRFARIPDALFPKIFGILFSTGIDMVAPSNARRQKNSASPGPKRLIAQPDMVWSALKVTAAIAWSAAISPLTAAAPITPIKGLPV